MMSNAGDAFQNQAEISEFADTDGNNSTDNPDIVADADSNPDATNGNDAGGSPGTDSDNAIDGDGSGVVGDGNAAGDEDDSDPALIQVIDVAIQKTIIDGQGPFQYGEPVDFLVKVFNQGNEPLHNVEVTDYIPAGYMYDVASDVNGWSFDGVNATQVIEGPMVQWDSVELVITLIPLQIIPSDDPTAWTNVAEVSQMFNEEGMDISLLDIDSQSDNIPDNDPGGEPGTDSDNSLDGDGINGGGSPGDTDADSDEDDSDPALLPIFDLALTKQLVFSDSIYLFGDEMEFVIEVTNQGNQTVTDVVVTEYIPGSLTEIGVAGDNSGWTFGGSQATYTIMDELDPGESVQIPLFMVFQSAAGGIEEYINVSEISEFADTLGNNSTDNPDIVFDSDSTPDDIEDNDEGGNPDFPGSMSGTDNTIDNENGDEDDHDPVLLGFVDMALAKTLVDPTTPIQVGDDVTFAIEVINQGTIPMVDIEVIDYIPAGYEFSANDTNGWTLDADGNARDTIAGPLGFDESVTLNIVLTVLPNANGENLINVAEIAEFFFPTGMEATDLDIDSQGDTIFMNDAGGDVYGDSDNAIDGDGTGAIGDGVAETDEDDEDPAVPQILDLALTKTIADGTSPVRPGDLVTFDIEVCNQGNIPVDEVTVFDYVPSGLLKLPNAADGWNLVEGNKWSFVIDQRIERAECVIIQIELEVLPNVTAADMINVAEIGIVIDTLGVDVSAFDIDSTPDDDNGEAAGTIGTADDNSTAGSVPNGEDSDDADPAAPPVMDLAIQKINPVMDTPSDFGDVIPFEVTVYNQGNMIAQNVEVTDYIPAGLALAAPSTGWTLSGANALFTVGELLPGTDTTIIIDLEVLEIATPMTVVNMVEISAAVDTFGNIYSAGANDYDSDYDSDNTNDVGNMLYDFDNDNVLGENGIGHGADGIDDEDDHDQAWVLLCEGLLCQGSLNISLDETCTANITAAMIVEGDLFPEHVYEITATDADGNSVDPQAFSGADIGQTFTVQVCNPLCAGNCCWTEVTIEDKFPPQIECVSDTISCGQLIVFPEPVPVDNCSGATIQLVNETTQNVDCDDPELRQIITREYIAIDAAGNESDVCIQTLSIRKFDISEVQAPATTEFDFECNEAFAMNAEGNPDATVYGGPLLGGVDLYQNQFLECNLVVSFTDQTIQTAQNATSIVRTWEALHWECGFDTSATFVQVFTISDTQGPEFTCPGDLTFTTSGIECASEILLPTLTVVDACSDVDEVTVQYEGGFIDANGGIANLAVGTSSVTYRATDTNGFESFCTFNVTVNDQEQPIAVCEQFTTVTLTNQGFSVVNASSFDDGSFDACGDVTIEVRRMNPTCDPEDAVFGEYVTFCCADVDTEQMVALRVTDESGNTNLCMIMAEVQDKVPPSLIQGLPDITLSCEFPFNEDDTEQFGMLQFDVDDIEPINLTAELVEFSGPATDGLVIGNCLELVSVEIVNSDFNTCGIGSAQRILTVSNPAGQTVQDVQNITFVNPSPFTLADIDFPGDLFFNNLCDLDELNPLSLPAGFDFPVITEDGCDQVGFDYQDDIVDSSDGALSCFVLTRTWTVIDWCQSGNGTFETFEGEQVITVINTIAPVITGDCTDRVEESLDPDCGPIFIELVNSATDDCTADEFIDYTYAIDLFSDGTIDVTGNTADASDAYPLGTHIISWLVEDGCGNDATCSYNFTLNNIGLPSPKCLDNLTGDLALMDLDDDGLADTVLLMVNPELFDAGSSDACGAPVQLSFSEDVTDTIRIFSCDDIGDNIIQLWVTDVDGNQDLCITSFVVQDNFGLCPAVPLTVDVTGELKTETDEMIALGEVELEGGDIKDVTEEDGMYGFIDMPTGGSYVVNPLKDLDHLNGITVADIILIQKHILGLSPLNSPFKILAADVDNSQKVNGTDIIQIRKLLLGYYDEFPSNTSWRFVDASHEFTDPAAPWFNTIPETYPIYNLAENMIINFRGYKVGDVNNTATPNSLIEAHVDTRSNETQEFILNTTELEAGATEWIHMYKETGVDLAAIQLGLSIDGSSLEILEVTSGQFDLDDTNYKLDRNEVRLIIAQDEAIVNSENLAVMSLLVRAKKDVKLTEAISINDEVLRAEAYTKDLELMNIEISTRVDETDNQVEVLEYTYSLDQNEPNPWVSGTSITFTSPKTITGKMNVRDVNGKLVLTRNMTFAKGENVISLDRSDISTGGVYYYEVVTDEVQIMKKMIVVQ